MDGEKQGGQLLRLVKDLRRARRALLDVMQGMPSDGLDSPADGSGWTVRRTIEYCGAFERWNMSRLYSYFDPEVKVYDDPMACSDYDAPLATERTLARECAEVWLVGRETEMWLDLIENENLDAVRHASAAWPAGGWTIREVFAKVAALYRESARTLAAKP